MQIAHVSALCLHSMSVLEPGVSVIRSSLRRISWDCVPSGGTKSDVEGLNTSDRYDRKPVLVRALLPERVSSDEAEALPLGCISRNEVEVLPLANEARLVRCCLLLAKISRNEAEALLLGCISRNEAEALLLGCISRNEVEVLPLENEARLLLAIVVRERFLRWSAERHTAFKL